jgi:hypothetical protein
LETHCQIITHHPARISSPALEMCLSIHYLFD